jgi:hypothetical protein
VARIEFKATVWAPMAGKGWTFVTLPKAASAKLGAKGRVPVQGTINGFAFRGSAFPDGEGSHQIAVNNDMKKGAGVGAGDAAAFSLEPATDEIQVEVPPALRKALAGHPGAKAQWDAITPKARDEWVRWVAGAKKEETRAARVGKTLERLAGGAKRPSD